MEGMNYIYYAYLGKNKVFILEKFFAKRADAQAWIDENLALDDYEWEIISYIPADMRGIKVL